MKPFCFVLMPFAVKEDSQGRSINFDAVYREAIAPGVEGAGLAPIRADEERMGGTIHKAMFERLMFCDYAVADLSMSNPNVLYELGVRHAVRPYSTLIIFCEGTRLPFDLASLRGTPYRIDSAGRLVDCESVRKELSQRLVESRAQLHDSPIFQMVPHFRPPRLNRAEADVFRRQVEQVRRYQDRLRIAQHGGVDKIREVEAELPDIHDLEPALKIELFEAYRAIKAFDEMLRLYDRMSREIQEMRMVQEQRALALNRLGRREEAEEVLCRLIDREGPSPETNGILGRVYKDRWKEALQANQPLAAAGFLNRAIDAYLRGFEIDCRDPYPGINAATLMELQDRPDKRMKEIIPVLRYALRRRLASSRTTYWDHASCLELAVVTRDKKGAANALASALAHVPNAFSVQSTIENLQLIRTKREGAGEDQRWVVEIEQDLARAADRFGPAK